MLQRRPILSIMQKIQNISPYPSKTPHFALTCTFSTPHGILDKNTNDQQNFTLDNKYGNRLVVEVISVKGEPKGISCHGTAKQGKTEILINCHSRYDKKHFY